MIRQIPVKLPWSLEDALGYPRGFRPIILIKRACTAHRRVTWHLVCLSGVLQCLECNIENRRAPDAYRQLNMRR